MLAHQPGRSGGAGGTPYITGALMFGVDMIEHPLYIGLDEAPCPLIFRLFLAPDNFRVRKAVEFLDKSAGWERIKLLQPQKVNVVDAPIFTLFK